MDRRRRAIQACIDTLSRGLLRRLSRKGTAVAAQALVCACLGMAGAAIAQSAEQNLDVPAGPLADTLIDLGRRFGVIVSFRPELVEGRQAAEMSGRYSLTLALAEVLRGTGLAARLAEGDVVVLIQRPEASRAPAPAVTAEADAGPPAEQAPALHVELPPAVVLADAGSTAGEGFSASYSDHPALDEPLLELPQAMSVITPEMLAMTQARSSDELLDFVGGVTRQYNFSSIGVPLAKVRGFPLGFSVNGLPSLHGTSLPLDSALIERAEMLRGPASVVGGVTDTGGRGGLVNLVLKRPRGKVAEVSATVNTIDDGMLRSTFDLGDGNAQGLSWRTTGYAMKSRQTEAGYDGVSGRGLLVGVTQRLEDLEATLSLQTNRRRDPAPTMTAVETSEPPFIKRSIGRGRLVSIDPEDGARSRSEDVELHAAWRLSDVWQLQGKLRRERGKLDMRRYSYERYFGMVDYEVQQIDERYQAGQLLLTGDFSLGDVGHRVLLGVESNEQRLAWSSSYAMWIVDPETFVPGQTPLPKPEYSGGEYDPYVFTSQVEQRGVLLQDRLSFGNWRGRLGVGLRRIVFHEEARDARPMSYPAASSWDAGVAYLLAPSATVYAGVQSAVEPCELQAIALLQTGRRYAPTRTRQTQAGTKVDLFGGKLGLRLEAYRIEQHDAMDFDPWDADLVLQRIPGTTSRGLDIEATGRLLPQLDLSLGFQFVRTRQVWLGVDDEFYAVPGTGGSSRSMQLLARYRVPPGQGGESSIGVAFRAYSHQWVSPPNPDGFNPSLRVPGGALLGLSWTRAAGPWSTTLALNNVFDRNLYGLATEDSFVVVQPRRSLALTLTYRP